MGDSSENVKRILVVDDQRDLREMLANFIYRSALRNESTSTVRIAKSKLLGKAPEAKERESINVSYVVDTAGQGEEAFERVKKALDEHNPYAVIFLDMRMPPGWDGLETMVRVWEVDARVQIILCTAYSDYTWEEIIERVGKKDNLLILKKPFDAAEVSQLALALTEKYSLSIATIMGMHKLEQAKEELRHTKNYLQNVFQSLPSMLITVDNDCGVIQWNKAAEKYITQGSESPVGKRIWDAVPFLNDAEPSLRKAMTTCKSIELRRMDTQNGDERYLNISISPLIYEKEAGGDGMVDGAIVRIDDATEMEHKDEHLRRAQKMDTVGSLAAGLAHDLNNVMGGIKGTLSSMRYTLENLEQNAGIGELKESMLDDIEVIEDAAKSGFEMMEQLFSLSKKKKEVSFQVTDLNPIIKSVMKICENTFPKCVQISTFFNDEPAIIKAYPSQLEQVLLNLCVNGCHAMTIMRKEDEPQGGILSVSLEKIFADENFCSNFPEAKPGEYWRLSVSDTGVGMDRATIQKIFDPFFTTKEKGKGTGLGLSMVYSIIRQHNGFIEVYSAPGTGSFFYAFLPTIDNGAEAPGSANATLAAQGVRG